MDEQRSKGSRCRERCVSYSYKAIVWSKSNHWLTFCDSVHNIIQKIGYPTKSPDIRDSAALEKYYADVNITSTAFFGNALSIAKFTVERRWSALGKPTNRDEWILTADTVNVRDPSLLARGEPPWILIADNDQAYYNPAGNEIVFPAGIMQAPVFYDPSIPQYLSYGAFGSVSGHELSHGKPVPKSIDAPGLIK